VETPGFLRGPVRVARTVWAHPWLALGSVALALLIAAWVAWAIHVGSKNGTDAAIGVLIGWPLLFFLAANLVLLVIGIRRLARRGEPGGPQRSSKVGRGARGSDEPAPEAAPGDATTEAG
jgi:membrane protein implicated in regulation of membrane protease activity